VPNQHLPAHAASQDADKEDEYMKRLKKSADALLGRHDDDDDRCVVGMPAPMLPGSILASELDQRLQSPIMRCHYLA